MPTATKPVRQQAKSTLDYLQQALEDLDGARSHAQHEARLNIDAAVDRIRDAATELRARAAEPARELEERLEQVSEDAACTGGSYTDDALTPSEEAMPIPIHERGCEEMSEVLVGREPSSPVLGPPLIQLAGVEKVYRTGKLEYRALRGVDLTIENGDMVAIVGPSGSGKSTIMNIITGIDRPSAGSVTVDGRRIDEMSEEDLAIWRGRRVGVVFQFFQLLPTLTALENAMLPLDFSRRVPKRERAALALRNLELVGLADRADNLPSELSGGQQQRVAIARALAADPPLLIGDEPTGNLDTRTAAEMFDLLQRLNAEGSTVLYVTHDRELAAKAHRKVTIRDGVVAA